jgi:hypothetical protein
MRARVVRCQSNTEVAGFRVSYMPENGENDTYSDYEMVSQMVTARVRDATTAYTKLNQAATAGVKLSRTDRVLFRADILEAAWLIESEMQAEQRRSNRRGQITDQLETWKNRGWIEKFAAAENPVREYEWAGQFVQMIREAAWELGYLKTNSVTDSTDDSDEFSDVDDLIEGMRV